MTIRPGAAGAAARALAAGARAAGVRSRAACRGLRRHRPRSLRGRLTAANVTLLAVGLVLAALTSLFGIYQVLVGEIDESLERTRSTIEGAGFTAEGLERVCTLVDALQLGSGAAASDAFDQNPFVVVGGDGSSTPICAEHGGRMDHVRTALARAVDGGAAGLARSDSPRTVHSGGHAFRVTAARLDDGGYVVSGVPLNGLRGGMAKLLVVEALVGVSLLGLLAMMSLAAARSRLRPLEDMVRTASAIAEGDLSRRVGVDGGSTEVEQLGNALNTMLHQIEGAFETRVRAAAQLRQFVADASHELRTPLASIRGYAQLYERGMLDEEERSRALARISSEGERMNQLVDALLSLARLEQGPAVRSRPVDLAQLARDGAADLVAQQPQRPVHVEAEGAVEVLGDEDRLRQVVGNLLSNVRTHTPADSPVIVRVSVGDGRAGPAGTGADGTAGTGAGGTGTKGGTGVKGGTGAAGTGAAGTGGPGGTGGGGGPWGSGGTRPGGAGSPGTACLRIADCGPGMRPQDAARVFDRFFRADPDRARVTGGSGLGMSIVHAVVEAHGGSVEVETEQGEGFAVTVRLARLQARGEASSTTVMSGGAPTRTGGPQKPAPRVT